jgi:hypothetical protein
MPVLRVKLISGNNLSAKDISGTSDPYCELKVANIAQRSRKIRRTRNPYWNEHFNFNISNPLADSLLISVFDWDLITRDDPLGYCLIPLNTLYRGEPTLLTYCLSHASRGSITVELTAVDFGLQRISYQQQPPLLMQQPVPPQQPVYYPSYQQPAAYPQMIYQQTYTTYPPMYAPPANYPSTIYYM